MSGQISGLNMAVRNANDGISLLQTVDGAVKEISSMLGRMRELAVQAASGTYTTSDQAALDLEFGALMDEITRISKDTEWNGEAILQGTLGQNYSSDDTALAKNIQIGTDSGQTMALSIKTWVPTVAASLNTATASLTATSGTGANSAYGATTALFGSTANNETTLVSSGNRVGVTSAALASIAITSLDTAIAGASAERAKSGSYMSRLQHASDNLQNIATNTAASRSQIADADYAAETTELARTQIISQASTAMLAQANQVKQTVLALLK